MAYDGLHLLAWNAPFRSRMEEWLWCGSGISVMAFGLSIVPLLLLVPSDVLLESSDDSKLYRSCFRLYLFSVLGLFLNLIYVAARVYLVVECFIDLAYLHDTVYEMPNWSQYFPHIS